MNARTPSSSSPQAPLRKRRLWRVWGWASLGVIVLPFLFLATPAGQRWAIRKAVEQLDQLMPDEAAPTRIAVGNIGIGWDPLGIALEEVQWSLRHDTSDAASLVHIRSLSIQPHGGDLRAWRRIHIEGVRIDTALTGWIRPLLPNGRERRSTQSGLPFAVSTLELADIQATLPSSLTGLATPLTLILNEAELDSLLWDGATLTWNEARAQLLAEGTVNGHPSAVSVLASGEPDGVSIELRDISPEGAVAVDVVDALPLRFSHAVLSANLLDRNATLRTAFDVASMELEARWSADSLQLLSSQFALSDAGLLSPVLADLGLQLHMEGRLSRAWADVGQIPTWGDPMLSGPVEWRAKLIGDATENSALSGTWTPSLGHIACEAELAPDLGIPHHDVHLSMQGDVPIWKPGQLDNAAELTTHWDGQWTISTTEDVPGWTSGTGDLAFDLGPAEDGRWSARVDAEGQCAPLSLTESLELYGDLSLRGEFKPTAEDAKPAWWTHLDLVNARWIPKPGFGDRAEYGAPLSMQRFGLQAHGHDAAFTADMDGDFVVGRIEGPLDVVDWMGPVQSALASGGFADAPASTTGWRDWTVDLTLLRDDLLERWSAGLHSIGPQSRITGSFLDGKLETRLDLTAFHSDAFRTGPLELVLSGGTSALHIALDARSARHHRAGRLDRLTLDASVSTDARSRILVDWTAPLAGHVEVEHSLEADTLHHIHPIAVDLEHASGSWVLDALHAGDLHWTGANWRSLMVDGIALNGELGRIQMRSAPDAPPHAAPLSIEVDGVPVEALATWASSAARNVPLPALSGTLNGQARVDLSSLHSAAYVQWQDARMPPYDLGDLCVDVRWTGSPLGSIQQFVADQEVLVASFDGRDHLMLDVQDWPLALINPLLDKSGVALKGTANGRVDLTLEDGVPQPRGNIALTLPEVRVDATGGRHAVLGTLNLSPGFIGMDQALVTDLDGHGARLNLSIFHEDYTQWNYDLGIDIEDDPFQVMDLPPGADRLFYGSVFATGQLDVSGNGDGVSIETEIRSEAGTRFTLPLDALEGTDIPSGIRFVGGAEPAPPAETARPFDLSLSLDIEVTPEAELALILDGRAGERVDGKANGLLSLSQSPSLPLAIQGGLDIVEGQYRFSLRDLFTKRIDIAPGGRIDWDGDPYAAELDLLAFSSLRANPAPILPSAAALEKTPVDVGMGIKGALEAPRLDFALSFPEYELRDPARLAEVQGVLSTREEVERQAFALLATGQFIPAGASGGFLTQTAATQASELVSARISEWLSGLSEDVDIGFRYVPPSEAGTGAANGENAAALEEAIELDLGLSLMNDRLQVSGSIGALGMDGFNLAGTEFRGGLDVRYRLTSDGRWELQAYQLPESPLEQNAKQGIGAAYQIRFDRLRELLQSGSR